MIDAPAKVDPTVRVLKGLADPTRLRLLALLAHGELTVGEICRAVEQSQPRVSRHLRLLSESGFLDRFREQQCVYYRAPARGTRAGWVRELLSALDPDDPTLRRDRVRIGVIVGERARLAAGKLAADKLAAGAAPGQEDAGLAALLREELGTVPLGELLDIGTGAGCMLELLGRQATRAVGIDRSALALRLARARLHGRGLAHCEFHRGNVYALPFAARSFDTITIARVLAGAERPVGVLSEAARTLRVAGRLLVVERCADLEAGGGASPLLRVRQWFEDSGLRLVRLRPCDLASGPHLLALASA